MKKLANTKVMAELFLYSVLCIMGISIVFNPWIGFNNPLSFISVMLILFSLFSFFAYFAGREEGDYELLLLSLVSLVIGVLSYYFRDGNLPMLLSFTLSSWSFFYITLRLITAYQYKDINYKKYSVKNLITAIVLIVSAISIFKLFNDDVEMNLIVYGYYFIVIAGLNFLEVLLNRIVYDNDDNNSFRLLPSAVEVKDNGKVVKVLVEDIEEVEVVTTASKKEEVKVNRTKEPVKTTPKKKTTTTKKKTTTAVKKPTAKTSTVKKPTTKSVAKKTITKKAPAKKTTTRKTTTRKTTTKKTTTK